MMHLKDCEYEVFNKIEKKYITEKIALCKIPKALILNSIHISLKKDIEKINPKLKTFITKTKSKIQSYYFKDYDDMFK
ncbi:unnamed protein product [marine sediment metagenome]|uniref:Uncharacterized protein n=1 Tax=marine sediment metagenome TaxID=412755 RepID=X1DWB5_9ZZZZ